MTGFSIPGLGLAKPNETLPPLPHDASNSFLDTATEPRAQLQEPIQAQSSTVNNREQGAPEGYIQKDGAKPSQAAIEDPMAVDTQESPLPLTHALEAAIGGLEESQTTPDDLANDEPQNDTNEQPEWELDSSPYESSSESSSSDSSDENSDGEDYKLLGIEQTAQLLMEAEGSYDDDGERRDRSATAAQLRTKNELPDETVAKPDVTITPDMKIEELGAVEHIVQKTMLIKAITPGEYQVLDTGSILCTADRVVIGAVAETIGKVLQPRYTVRFNTEDEIHKLGLGAGTKIFYSVAHASYVFTQPLRSLRGSDASNIHDEEVGDDELDFSDDEKEAEYKRAVRQRNKNKCKGPPDSTQSIKGPHPLRQTATLDAELNHDEDGPYKTLARPPGFGSGSASCGSIEAPPRASPHRGGRRGDRRGRGGRGRASSRGGFSQPRDTKSHPPLPYRGLAQQSSGSWVSHTPLAVPTQDSSSSAPSFGFGLGFDFQPPSVWPHQASTQAPAAAHPPPPIPPPGWPAQQQLGQGPSGTFINPAFVAALMSQMQAPQEPPPRGWP